MKNLHQQIVKQLGNPLEWQSHSKASLLLWVFFIEQLAYYAVPAYVLSTGHFSEFYNFDLTRVHLAAFQWLIIGNLFLIAVLKIQHTKNGDRVYYEYIATLYFGLVHVYYGYTIGLMSIATGVVLACAPLVGFIFFHGRAVLWATTTSAACVVILTVLTSANTLPYAPLTSNLYTDNGNLSVFWLSLYFFYISPHIISMFGIAYYVLYRWREREQEVRYLSNTDPLTGLMNRRCILDHLGVQQHNSDITAEPLSVLMVDLDHFKQINDTWGHGVGDEVLMRAADILKKTVRKNDYVGRYGGEEFLIVLPGLGKEKAVMLAERIRRAIASMDFRAEEKAHVPITASLGLCSRARQEAIESGELIRRADVALYKAKHTGRDRLEVAA
ncbi:MAG: GGDEF domain-containing protein [Pseudomonadales bacterium]|nr:GGDEF domain-containing protein [Pseudomonadales bacterium]